MTFSIVACDPEQRQWGAALATARPAAASRCLFTGTAGVVATQATTNTALAFGVLDALASGVEAATALTEAIAADPRSGVRQVITVGSGGEPGAWTGTGTPEWSGHLAGPGLAVAGNILTGPQTLLAMYDGYLTAGGDLADRLIAALAAGDRAGGDRRGRQSAAVLVANGQRWPLLDLRVDNQARPITALLELRQRWREEWEVYDRTGVFPPARPPGDPGP